MIERLREQVSGLEGILDQCQIQLLQSGLESSPLFWVLVAMVAFSAGLGMLRVAWHASRDGFFIIDRWEKLPHMFPDYYPRLWLILGYLSLVLNLFVPLRSSYFYCFYNQHILLAGSCSLSWWPWTSWGWLVTTSWRGCAHGPRKRLRTSRKSLLPPRYTFI